MFRYLFSVISFLFIIISPCVANIASSEYVNEMRNNVQAKIDKKANNANYAQNMVLQTDNSGNVVATTVGTDLFADGAIETMHLADGAVTNADLAGMIDITKLNLGTLPTSGKHMMIWNAETQKYVFERYATSILPDGYTQLEYIESTGTQYIDTGIYPFSAGKVYVKWSPIKLSSNYMCGARVNSQLYSGVMGAVATSSVNSTMVRDANNSSSITYDIVRYVNNVYEVTTEAEYVDGYGYHTIGTINNITTGTTDSKFSSTYITNPISTTAQTVFLLAVNTSNIIVSTRVYQYKYWDNDRMLVRNFVPAKRNSDGEIGMYDTVTNNFFRNAGTGNFIAGPEVE